MANILVIYDSRTGRTKAMAELVAQGAMRAQIVEVRLKSIDEAKDSDILWADGLAVGSPTNLGAMSWKMKKFWDERSQNLWGRIDGKIACAFSSAGSYGGGQELVCMNILSVMINYGFLVFGVTDYVGPQFSPHYGAVVAGSPDTQDKQEACLRLGQRLAQWVVMFMGQKNLRQAIAA